MRIFVVVFCFLASVATTVCAADQADLPPGVEALKYGVLSGKVLQDGKPLPFALISVFGVDSGPPPDKGATRRVPEGLIKVRTDGSFRVKLGPGRYYFGVVSREDRSLLGPPATDEPFFFVRDAEGGELRIFEVVEGQDSDIGVLTGSGSESFPDIENYYSVQGTITDKDGKPFEGALILVREQLTIPRPLFISERTGADGKYTLKIPAGQSVFLVVRESLVNVGRPRPGNFVGTYGAKAPGPGQTPTIFLGGKPVVGEVGTVLTGIDITMYKIPDPEELKKDFQAQSESVTPPGSDGMRVKPPRP